MVSISNDDIALLPLSFDAVKQLVEATSSVLELVIDNDQSQQQTGDKIAASSIRCSKGRFLIARRALKAGDIVLSERPLVSGTVDGTKSRIAYCDAFTALLEEAEHDEYDVDPDEDRLHPGSPLVDCVASILLTREQAADKSAETQLRERATLCLQKLSALHAVGGESQTSDDCPKDLFNVLRPSLQRITSEKELHHLIQVLRSNRFGDTARMDVMFAGSMFEHSCFPNVFGAAWPPNVQSHYKTYRALRDIAQHEPLSINYLDMPDSYLPAAGRAQLLGQWDFRCECLRCTELPDVPRSFMCPACGVPELVCYPSKKQDAFVCRLCHQAADPDYVDNCIAREKQLEDHLEDPSFHGDSLVSCFHYMSFHQAWAQYGDGPAGPEDIPMFKSAVEALIKCLVHLHEDSQHPQLLHLYHTMATLEQGDVEVQRRWLDREYDILLRFFPEDTKKKDQEIMDLIQGGLALRLNSLD